MLVDLVEKLAGIAAAGSQSSGEARHRGDVVFAYRQVLSVALMYARTGALRDAVQQSIEPHAAERRERSRQEYVYRVLHRAPRFYSHRRPILGSGRGGAQGSERVSG